MNKGPMLPTDRALLADLFNRQMNRIAVLDRQIAEVMASLDKREQKR